MTWQAVARERIWRGRGRIRWNRFRAAAIGGALAINGNGGPGAGGGAGIAVSGAIGRRGNDHHISSISWRTSFTVATGFEPNAVSSERTTPR